VPPAFLLRRVLLLIGLMPPIYYWRKINKSKSKRIYALPEGSFSHWIT